jgi:hypothetical protein
MRKSKRETQIGCLPDNVSCTPGVLSRASRSSERRLILRFRPSRACRRLRL